MRAIRVALSLRLGHFAAGHPGVRNDRPLVVGVLMRANGRRIFSFLFTGRHFNLGGKGVDYCGEHLRDLQTHRKSQPPHFSLVPRAG